LSSLCLEICCKQHSTSQVINLPTLSPYTDSIFQSLLVKTRRLVSLHGIVTLLYWFHLSISISEHQESSFTSKTYGNLFTQHFTHFVMNFTTMNSQLEMWTSEWLSELWPVLLTEWVRHMVCTHVPIPSFNVHHVIQASFTVRKYGPNSVNISLFLKQISWAFTAMNSLLKRGHNMGMIEWTRTNAIDHELHGLYTCTDSMFQSPFLNTNRPISLQGDVAPIRSTFLSFCSLFHGNSLQWTHNWKR
jgi:hypothetical protein